MIVVRFEIINIVDDRTDPFGMHFFGNKGAVGFQRFLVQCARHHIVVGKLDERMADLVDVSLIRGLPHKDGADSNKSGND